jgi:hypothetical protein
MSDKKDTKQVHIEFIGEIRDKFETLKKFYGIQNNAELIRILIDEKAKQLNISPMETTTNANQ